MKRTKEEKKWLDDHFREARLKNSKWNLENLKAGFDKFFSENGRYPTSVEVTKYSYLPSAKTIDRLFGGLEILRTKLGLEITNYTKGKNRSNQAKFAAARSEETQNKLKDILIKKFGEIAVHQEAPFGDNSKMRADFLIFHKDGSLWIDVFYPGNRGSFYSCLNFKIKKYDPRFVWGKTFFVNANPAVLTDISTKKLPLLDNQIAISLAGFIEHLNSYKPISIS